MRVPTGPASWRTEPLEYRFRVGAPQRGGEVTLSATEYRGGMLDWYHFSRVPNATGLGAKGGTHTHDVMALPAPLRFEGMPAARFWAIEDETVSFGDLVGGPEDLVRAIVGAFAAVYRDDWMVVPCQVPAGSVSRVTSLVVHDDYGARHEIPATAVVDGPGRVWKFFELDDVAGPGPPIPQSRPEAPLLLVAPALPDSEAGPPLERVDMIRDQVANLAWAIERRASAASGRPFEREAAASPAEPADAGDAWSYVAYTPVPEHWIPLVPVRGEDEQVHLRRGRVALPPPGVPEGRLLPMGRLLDASAPMWVNEDAIPDAGAADRPALPARPRAGRPDPRVGRPPGTHRRLAGHSSLRRRPLAAAGRVTQAARDRTHVGFVPLPHPRPAPACRRRGVRRGVGVRVTAGPGGLPRGRRRCRSAGHRAGPDARRARRARGRSPRNAAGRAPRSPSRPG